MSFLQNLGIADRHGVAHGLWRGPSGPKLEASRRTDRSPASDNTSVQDVKYMKGRSCCFKTSAINSLNRRPVTHACVCVFLAVALQMDPLEHFSTAMDGLSDGSSVSPEPHSSSKQPVRRASKACLACRARKVRCDVTIRSPCGNCQWNGQQCVTHARRARRYVTICMKKMGRVKNLC